MRKLRIVFDEKKKVREVRKVYGRKRKKKRRKKFRFLIKY